jgi:hypothetical protein
MEIKKRCKANSYKRQNKNFYIKRCGRYFNVTALVRDAILPHRFLKVDICEEGIIIIPSDCKDDYKLTVSDCGQSKFACSYLLNFIDIPESVELPVEKREDGSLLVTIKKSGDPHGL